MRDVRLHHLATRQHWLVTRRQLAELGYTRRQVEDRLASGALFRVHHEVYGVAGAPTTFEFNAMAACLAGGDGAVGSHRCAAALFGLRRITCDVAEITVLGRRAPKIPGVVTHRTDDLDPGYRARIGRIPVTAPARILLDLAGELPRRILEGALDDVIVRHLAGLHTIERILEGSRRPGASLLRELVEARRRGVRPTETVLEDELWAVLRRFGLPEPERQVELDLGNGRKAVFDGAFPRLRLGLEADGDEFHAGLLDRRRDEERDERCRALGWTVRRFSTEDIRGRPAEVAAEVARLLGLADAG